MNIKVPRWKSYLEIAVDRLKEAGFKITKPRLLLLNLLENSEEALSPYEMRDLLTKQGIKADVVTIYRILDVLEKHELVHKIMSLGKYTKCHFEDHHNDEDCHHYVICKNCQKIEEIAGDDLENLEKKIVKQHKFKILSHNLEFVGICSVCQ